MFGREPDADPAREAFAGIAAVTHAVSLLKALPPDGTAVGVNELARRVCLHKSTVSRLVATLDRHELVQRDAENGRVSLGMGLVALVAPLLGNLDVVKAAKPILKTMAEETGETVSLALWGGQEAVIVEQTLGARSVVHYAWPGKTVPAHATAAGKIFLAFLPPDAAERVPQGDLRRCTPRTITDPAALALDLERARRRGFAVNDEENELESCGVAAPVRNHRGELSAALTVAIPKHRFDPSQQETMARAVLRGAERLSRRLGWSAGG
jgi:DNA-binding IclR family transcriptional regulator